MSDQKMLERLLRASFVLYFQAHSFHWNVRGKDFFSLHAFFEKMYQSIWESLDTIAEKIRIGGGDAPRLLSEISQSEDIVEDSVSPPSEIMLEHFSNNLAILIDLLQKAIQQTKDESLKGFLTNLEEAYRKKHWMIHSSLFRES